jgi:type III secretion system YscQ/HrcQ family protein
MRRLPRVDMSQAEACGRLLAVLARAGLRARTPVRDTRAAAGWRIAMDSDYGPMGFTPLQGGGRPLSIGTDDRMIDLAGAGAALDASEPLLASIERALGTPLWPRALDRDTGHARSTARIEVRIDADGGDCALLSACPEVLRRLPAPHWEVPPPGLLGIGVACRIRIGGCTVGATRLAALGIGDLLLETTQAALPWTVRVRVPDGPQTLATLQLDCGLLTFDSEEYDEMDLSHTVNTTHAPGRPDSPDWVGIPTELHFELPGITLPLGTVAGLQPGAVMRIEADPGALQVEVLAGGRTVGRGELVAIGDGFGVRLIERLIDGP